MKLSVIIPCYNEEQNIKATVHEIQSSKVEDYEIIIVDDASTDNTYNTALGLSEKYPNIRVIRNEKNLNLGGSFKRALLESQGEYIIEIHGKNDIKSSEIDKIIDKIGSADIIVPFQINKHERTIFRRVISTLYTAAINYITGNNISYYNHYALYTRKSVSDINLVTNGYAFQAEIICKLLFDGASYCEVGVIDDFKAEHRTKAFSLMNIKEVLRFFVEISKLHARNVFIQISYMIFLFVFGAFLIDRGATTYFNKQRDFRYLDVDIMKHSIFDRQLGFVASPNEQGVGPYGFKKPVIKSHRKTIVLLGDSVVYGMRHSPEHSISSLLQTKMDGFNVINWGGIGYSSAQSLLSFKRFVDQFGQPDYVIWLNGGNDYVENFDPGEYLVNRPMLKQQSGSYCMDNLPVKRLKSFFRNPRLNSEKVSFITIDLLYEIYRDIIEIFPTVKDRELLEYFSLHPCDKNVENGDGVEVMVEANARLNKKLGESETKFFSIVLPYKFNSHRQIGFISQVEKKLTKQDVNYIHVAENILKQSVSIFLTDINDKKDDHFSVETHDLIATKICEKIQGSGCSK